MWDYDAETRTWQVIVRHSGALPAAHSAAVIGCQLGRYRKLSGGYAIVDRPRKDMV